MIDQKIAWDELVSLFGANLPLSAMKVLTDEVTYPTPDAARAALHKIVDERRAELTDPEALGKLIESLRRKAHEEAEAHRMFVDMRYGPSYSSICYTRTASWTAADTIEALLNPTPARDRHKPEKKP